MIPRLSLIKHIKYIPYSINLDKEFLKISPFSFYFNCRFLLIKYLFLLKHQFKKFKFGIDHVNLDQAIYYNSIYGIVDYQACLVHHYNLIKLMRLERLHNVIDIGANVGFFIILIKNLYPDSNVYGIEPLPNIFKVLKENLIKYDQIYLSNVAIGETNQSSKMIFDSRDTYQSRISEIGDISVQVTSLDCLLSNSISNVDLLKIDVEGFEAKVLRGAKNILSRTRYLILEVITADDQVIFTEVMSLLHNPPFYSFQLRGMHNFENGGYYVSGADYLFENVNYLE